MPQFFEMGTMANLHVYQFESVVRFLFRTSSNGIRNSELLLIGFANWFWILNMFFQQNVQMRKKLFQHIWLVFALNFGYCFHVAVCDSIITKGTVIVLIWHNIWLIWRNWRRWLDSIVANAISKIESHVVKEYYVMKV